MIRKPKVNITSGLAVTGLVAGLAFSALAESGLTPAQTGGMNKPDPFGVVDAGQGRAAPPPLNTAMQGRTVLTREAVSPRCLDLRATGIRITSTLVKMRRGEPGC